jgi:transcriptional regulator with XRE-family HTH domain
MMYQVQDILNFGKRLKELRLKQKLSLDEISAKAGVTLATYQEWEQGEWILDEKDYFNLADALGVTSELLIFGSEKTRMDG